MGDMLTPLIDLLFTTPLIDMRDVLRRDPCAYCGAIDKTTIDHVEPRSDGGVDDWTNLTAACGTCNASKCDDHLLLWLLRSSPRRWWPDDITVDYHDALFLVCDAYERDGGLPRADARRRAVQDLAPLLEEALVDG